MIIKSPFKYTTSVIIRSNNIVIIHRSIATLRNSSLLGCKIQGTYLIVPLKFTVSTRFMRKMVQKVLTENLRKMEQDGIIIRKAYPVVPPKVEYSLSELGDSLRPIIDAMSDWGTNYIQENLMEA